jgi:hypothetical protein
MYWLGKHYASLIFLTNFLQSNSFDNETLQKKMSKNQDIRKIETILSWNKLEFDLNVNEQQKKDSIKYIHENNLLGNVRKYNNFFYISVPRYQDGVPATLNIVEQSIEQKVGVDDNNMNKKVTNSPKLRPFPSLKENLIGDCTSLQNVFALEIDPLGRLWVIDSGNAELYIGSETTCNAKIHIYQLGKCFISLYQKCFIVVKINSFVISKQIYIYFFHYTMQLQIQHQRRWRQ